MEGVIVEVEVDDALPDAIILSRVLNDWLEEVGLEIEDLNKKKRSEFDSRALLYRCNGLKTYMSVVLKPLWWDSWNGVILLSRAFRDASEALGRALAHALQDGRVRRFLKGDSSLCTSHNISQDKL